LRLAARSRKKRKPYQIRNQTAYFRKKMGIILNLTRVIFSVKEEEVRDMLIRPLRNNYLKLVLVEQQRQTQPWQWLHPQADRIDLQRP
jgi:NADPH-dependent ferric siderophore reductase